MSGKRHSVEFLPRRFARFSSVRHDARFSGDGGVFVVVEQWAYDEAGLTYDEAGYQYDFAP